MKNVEDIYRLSPMQDMMLLHALTAGDADVLFNQFCYTIDGDLDIAAFRAAWEALVESQPVLRSTFLWEEIKQPLQVVRQRVTLPFEELDWSGLDPADPADRRARLDRFLDENRARGFEISKAPLMRVTVIRHAPDTHTLVWSSHHLILDRWCIAIVLDAVIRRYEAIRSGARGDAVSRGAPFRNYIAWIQRQDRSRAREFWRGHLAGFARPSRLMESDFPTIHGATSSERLTLGASAAIRDFARQSRLTVSTIFQGALSFLLNRSLTRADVLFGAAVAGRPADLPGVETMLGSFINNLPVRIRLPGDDTVRDWLRSIQSAQSDRAPFEYVSGADVQRWCALGSGPLFDVMLVWLSAVEPTPSSSLELRGLEGEVRTAHPVTVSVEERDEGIVIDVVCKETAGRTIDARELARALAEALDTLVSHPDTALSALPGYTGDAPREPLATPQLDVGSLDETEEASAEAALGREDDETELLGSLVVSEWRALLEIEQIAPDDDFFEIGGNSVLAVQLHSRLEAATGRSIPILSLFRAPTVDGMTATLRERRWPLQAGMVRAIQPRGSKPPLLCIASPEVNTLGYVLLARHLDDDQPVFVLQATPRAGRLIRLTPPELPGLAAEYVEAARAALGDGPFRLLGMCRGAHIAHEMAKKLGEESAPVEFLGVVNTWALYTLSWLWHVNRRVKTLRYLARRLRSLIRSGPRRQLAEVGRILGGRKQTPETPDSTRQTKDEAATRPSKQPPRGSGEQPGDASDGLYADHRGRFPPKFPGRVTVFRMHRQQFFRIRNDSLGWDLHADEAEVIRLDVEEHLGILREPHVRTMARLLSACFEKLDARRGAADTKAGLLT